MSGEERQCDERVANELRELRASVIWAGGKGVQKCDGSAGAGGGCSIGNGGDVEAQTGKHRAHCRRAAERNELVFGMRIYLYW